MKKTLATALFALPMLASAATNLVTNGSFEDTVISNSNGWDIFSSIAGWTGGAAGIEVRRNAVGQAFEGNNFVELDTTANSSMSQLLATTANQNYTLSFNYANRIGTDAVTNGLQWSLDGSNWTTLTPAAASNGSHAWQSFSTSFVASGSTQLSFRAIGSSDTLGTSLDNISVTTAVPEPSSYALLLAGLATMGFVARRRA